MTYTRDRVARRRRLQERGHEDVARAALASPRPSLLPKCRRCDDAREVVVQGVGLVPCPECNGAA